MFRLQLQNLTYAPDPIVDNLFRQCSDENNAMDFRNYTKAFDLIRAQSKENTVEIILRTIDCDNNGYLSYEEIFARSMLVFKE